MMITSAQWNCCFESASRAPAGPATGPTTGSEEPPHTETHREIALRCGRIIVELRCQSEDDCPICLEPLKNKKVKYTPCGHCMHSKCLNAQMASPHPSAFSCALCRYNLIPHLPLEQLHGHLRSRTQSPPPPENEWGSAIVDGFGFNGNFARWMASRMQMIMADSPAESEPADMADDPAGAAGPEDDPAAGPPGDAPTVFAEPVAVRPGRDFGGSIRL